MIAPILLKEWRGNVLENVHHGLVCGIDAEKQPIFSVGDTTTPVFYRSALKPIQAIPVFETAVFEKYGISTTEAALCTASQRGELYHQHALQSLLEKLGLAEDQLVCHASYPLNEAPKFERLWQQQPHRKLHHNCAGKHLGLLAACRAHGWPEKDYEHLDHPVQQRILDVLSILAEVPKEEIELGTDGCGVPVFAVPLQHMAISYLKFAVPELIEDQALRKTVTAIGDIMNQHPTIVASHNFICTALLEDDNIVAKGGAQGVYCFALRKEKMAFALKVLSGAEHVWPFLVANLLEQIHYDNKDTIERLHKLRSKTVVNDAGVPVGKSTVHLVNECNKMEGFHA
ncbi:asparaginase [Aureibacillus halotolerans]|uniref:Asparaginase n=1 Tax=Aureibacillus halotolerans TaxID=1508390 RepID=A0A4R6U3J7_9BACI|nr:asparaginase [Aureibacillus halotolerans]TDQ41048.1 asparaginase [Aureibacillus halotolerans]